MKQGLLSLAGIALAMAVAMPAHADLTTSIQNFNQATYNLAQAYPCAISGYRVVTTDDKGNPVIHQDQDIGIADLRVWGGSCSNNDTRLPAGQAPLAGAAPGLLCLARNGLALDVNCFMVTPNNQFGPCFVQAFRLTKQVPGSFKCPDVYGPPHFVKDSSGNMVLSPYTYVQFGNGVRTWWSLNFTQPGTRFILEVVSVCRTAAATTTTVNGVSTTTPGNAVVHKDTWTWQVVASPATLRQLIEVMHGGAVSTLEVPCIIGEDMYDALVKAANRLQGAVGPTDIGNAIFDMEALVVSNCLFVDVLDPLQAFPGAPQMGMPNFQPPGNLSPSVPIGNNGTAIAGIIDTIENPCCCKLLVDLEYIAIFNGIVGQLPTLPTFH